MPQVFLHGQPEGVEDGPRRVGLGVGYLDQQQSAGAKDAPQFPQRGDGIEQVFEHVAAEDGVEAAVVDR